MIVIFLQPHLILQTLPAELQGSPGSRVKLIGDLVSQIYAVRGSRSLCHSHDDPTAKAPEAVQSAKTVNCRPFLMVTFILKSATVMG